jgi:hypothetical protein
VIRGSKSSAPPPLMRPCPDSVILRAMQISVDATPFTPPHPRSFHPMRSRPRDLPFYGNTERRLPDLRPSMETPSSVILSRARRRGLLLDHVSLTPTIHAIPRAIATSTIGALTPFKEMAESHSIVDAAFHRQRPKSSRPHHIEGGGHQPL